MTLDIALQHAYGMKWVLHGGGDTCPRINPRARCHFLGKLHTLPCSEPVCLVLVAKCFPTYPHKIEIEHTAGSGDLLTAQRAALFCSTCTSRSRLSTRCDSPKVLQSWDKACTSRLC
eukprot:623255-Amphidinium_carterae.1